MGSNLSLWILVHPYRFHCVLAPLHLLLASDHQPGWSMITAGSELDTKTMAKTDNSMISHNCVRLTLSNKLLSLKKKKEEFEQCLSSSSLIIYHTDQASFLCLGKLSYSFLSLDQFSTFYLSCFRCHKLSPGVSLLWSVLPVSFPLGHLCPLSQIHFSHLFW